nr:putative ribonuclease H-like domain-containing protein [Tanacetum cinerariifolium]
MLIYAQAPLFLWVEAVATACFTQNQSIIRLRHGKTLYELMHVDQDAPSPSKSPTPTEIQSLVILQDVGNDNLDIEVAHMGNDPLIGVPITEVASGQSSSIASPQSIVQPNHPMTHHNSKWIKDHPLNYIIGPLSRPVSTRLQLHEQA